jgi:Family of unknown function (DUF6111)
MIRAVVENVLLFLLPTAMYIGYVLLTRRAPANGANPLSDAPLVWLFVAGALLVAATLVYYASITPGSDMTRVYTPPQMMKDGHIEPGQLK